VSTGATQDLFRCLSEQLHIARTEIPQKYALVVKLVLEAFTQYRHVQLKRVYARGVEQDVSMDRICSVANNLSRCVPLLDTLRDDIDIDLVGMDQDIVEDTLDDLGDAFGLTASSAIRCLCRQVYHSCYSDMGHHLSRVVTEQWRQDDTLLQEIWLTLEDFFRDFGWWLMSGLLLRDLLKQCLQHFVQLYLTCILMGPPANETAGGDGSGGGSGERSSSESKEGDLILLDCQQIAGCLDRDIASVS
jgi:hypothetical protein